MREDLLLLYAFVTIVKHELNYEKDSVTFVDEVICVKSRDVLPERLLFLCQEDLPSD